LETSKAKWQTGVTTPERTNKQPTQHRMQLSKHFARLLCMAIFKKSTHNKHTQQEHKHKF